MTFIDTQLLTMTQICFYGNKTTSSKRIIIQDLHQIPVIELNGTLLIKLSARWGYYFLLPFH